MARLFSYSFPVFRFIKGFSRLIRLLADLNPRNEHGLFDSAAVFLQERDNWLLIMNSVQFDQKATSRVIEGLATRHGEAVHEPFGAIPEKALLGQITPLIWFFYRQKELFHEDTVGHGCTVTLLYTLFRAAKPGATRADVLQAVRFEMDAQMQDVCSIKVRDGALFN